MTVGAEITIWRYGKKTRWLGKGIIPKVIFRLLRVVM
jgi:hypothetical protein